MQPPVFRRYSIADVPRAPEWLTLVFGPLNVFSEQVVQLFSKNLVIGENVQGSKFSYTFSTPAAYAAGDFSPISYVYTGGGAPSCLLVGKVVDVTGALILSPVSVTSWLFNTNENPPTIVVNYIAGLTAGQRYAVTLLAL